MPDEYDYGILGVGEIGTAIVTGLCEGVDDAPRILLSPRNAGRAAALAARYPSVAAASDNQAVIDSCAAVVLSVRPADGRALLPGLAFRPSQAIISAMAGVPDDELAALVAPARDIARAIPLPPVSRRAGITPVHPGRPRPVRPARRSQRYRRPRCLRGHVGRDGHDRRAPALRSHDQRLAEHPRRRAGTG